MKRSIFFRSLFVILFCSQLSIYSADTLPQTTVAGLIADFTSKSTLSEKEISVLERTIATLKNLHAKYKSLYKDDSAIFESAIFEKEISALEKILREKGPSKIQRIKRSIIACGTGLAIVLLVRKFAKSVINKCLLLSCKDNNLTDIHFYHNLGGKPTFECLIYAIINNQQDAVELFLNSNVDPNERITLTQKHLEGTPLDPRFINSRVSAIHAACLSPRTSPEILRVLLRNNVNIDGTADCFPRIRRPLRPLSSLLDFQKGRVFVDELLRVDNQVMQATNEGLEAVAQRMNELDDNHLRQIIENVLSGSIENELRESLIPGVREKVNNEVILPNIRQQLLDYIDNQNN